MTEAAQQGQESSNPWLPESLQDNQSLSRFENLEGLAEAYINAERSISERIKVPTEEADDKVRQDFFEKIKSVDGIVRIPTDPEDSEGWNSLFSKMGRPEKAEGYEHGSESEKELFHKAGIASPQARLISEHYKGLQEAQTEEQNEATKAKADALKAEWGDSAERNMTNAKLAATKYLGEEFSKRLDDPADPLSLDSDVLNLLAKIGGGEKGSVPLDSSSQGFNLSPSEIEDRIEELLDSKAYQNGEERANKKLREYYLMLEKAESK